MRRSTVAVAKSSASVDCLGCLVLSHDGASADDHVRVLRELFERLEGVGAAQRDLGYRQIGSEKGICQLGHLLWGVGVDEWKDATTPSAPSGESVGWVCITSCL